MSIKKHWKLRQTSGGGVCVCVCVCVCVWGGGGGGGRHKSKGISIIKIRRNRERLILHVEVVPRGKQRSLYSAWPTSWLLIAATMVMAYLTRNSMVSADKGSKVSFVLPRMQHPHTPPHPPHPTHKKIYICIYIYMNSPKYQINKCSLIFLSFISSLPVFRNYFLSFLFLWALYVEENGLP